MFVSLVALKVILVCFERQLGSQWYWLSLQVKEMALRKVGGLALWDFLDFIVRTRIPIFVLLRPFIQCKVNPLPMLNVSFPGQMTLLNFCQREEDVATFHQDDRLEFLTVRRNSLNTKQSRGAPLFAPKRGAGIVTKVLVL